LAAGRVIARAGIEQTIIDRRNHHLFQPLLYQVAMAALAPAQVASPIRKVFSRYKRTEVLMAEVRGFDLAARKVLLDQGEVGYDYLVVAAGATHSYFGHDEWEKDAPGLKSLEDAITIRRRFLLAFEKAEREEVEEKKAEHLTFVIVGGGPTGVELAGAMVEIARDTIPKDFRAINTREARVVLVEAGERVLAAFPEDLSKRAEKDLKELGVEVMLGWRVTEIDGEGVTLEKKGEIGAPPSKQRIATKSVTWAAGVAASPLGKALGGPVDRSGRVIVEGDLSLPGHPEVFVIGDLASVKEKNGQPVPGIAPAAIQMGKYVGHLIVREVKHGRGVRKPFAYFDKGTLATIGRARAVAALPVVHLGGFIAWAIWALVHIAFLISFRAKVLVMIDWIWSYLFYVRGSRLITGEGGGAAEK
jgi:NADH dehydrogenase